MISAEKENIKTISHAATLAALGSRATIPWGNIRFHILRADDGVFCFPLRNGDHTPIPRFGSALVRSFLDPGGVHVVGRYGNCFSSRSAATTCRLKFGDCVDCTALTMFIGFARESALLEKSEPRRNNFLLLFPR
tara:strand:- start:218 stop:622 length:405 start_codon:yes stop_codon:yes gene_type:complete